MPDITKNETSTGLIPLEEVEKKQKVEAININ